MTRGIDFGPNPYDTIRRLENELYSARHSILSLMPDEIEDLLTSYHYCESRVETYRWEGNATAEIIERAKKLPQPEGSVYFMFSSRAYCPLCGRGSSSPFSHEEGFSIPEGLRRHLVGEGNVHQCPVFGAAMKLARDYWHEKFHDQELAEEAEKQARILERRKTEVLYQVSLNEKPQLIDEGLYSSIPRNTDELAWAEDRLQSLGFQIACESNVKSYINERENFVVYADPRAKGEITFKVYKKPLPKSSRRRPMHSFNLKDNWKNDIPGKYESRLARVIGG